VGGAAPPRDGEVAGVGAAACYADSGVAGVGQRGGIAWERPRAGRRNSGEGFRSRGEGLRRGKAWDTFSRGRGTLGTNARALGQANLAGHRTGAADHHGRTPAKPKLADNKAKLGKLSTGTCVSPRGGARGGLARSPAS
jgi:hypothetical protein